ncbi:hypothetical protein GA0115233_103384, partial [Streptomyces sp. DI166]
MAEGSPPGVLEAGAVGVGEVRPALSVTGDPVGVGDAGAAGFAGEDVGAEDGATQGSAGIPESSLVVRGGIPLSSASPEESAKPATTAASEAAPTTPAASRAWRRRSP